MASFVYAELAGLWIEAGGPGIVSSVAAAIAEAESGGDSTKINNTAYQDLAGYHHAVPGAQPEYSVGLWQINLLAHPSYTKAEMLDPLQNAKAAVAISDGGANFDPWSTYTSGAYRQYVQFNFTPVIPDLGAGQVTPSGGLSSTPSAAGQVASGLRGYADLRNSVSRHLPTQLIGSRRAGAATLRTLAHRSKVKG